MILPLLLGIASTLPLGPAGYSIVENTINHGTKKGVRSLGELQLVEFSYLFLGVIFFSFLKDAVVLQGYLEFFAALFISFFGLSLILKKEKLKNKQTKSTWLYAILNPGILILYISVITLYRGSIASLALFQLGSIFAIAAIIVLASKKQKFLTSRMSLIKKIIGVLFIFTGIIKTISII